MKSKSEWIDEYYEKYFNDLCNSGIQGKGSSFIHKKIEKYLKNNKPSRILEVGAGDGAHFKFTKIRNNSNVQLTALDVRIPSKAITELELGGGSLSITWIEGNVEKIPLEDEIFDRVTSTCLLHHVDDPLAAMLEMRRVTAISGEISIGLPTDPGLANRFIKKLYTYKKARNLGMENPAFVYSLDHQNHIFGLIEIAKYVFRKDDLSINYLPFKVKSANLNLLVVLKVVKK
jgi:ubiquinone/menaquinone biosynthesis C-methylase UbiE